MRDDATIPSAEARPQVGQPAHPIRRFLFSLSGLTVLFLMIMVAYPGWGLELNIAMVGLAVLIVAVSMLTTRGPILARCLLPFLVGGLCVEAYILVHEWGYAPGVMKYFIFGDHYNEIFYSAVATLYAIITALALVKGIEDFDLMKRNVADEAYRVRAISEMTYYFDYPAGSGADRAVRELKMRLLAYARNVAAMKDQSLKAANLQLLRECQRDIVHLTPEDENDRIALTNIMQAHNELGVLRSKRINAVGEKIPRYLIWALWIMAAGLILPFMAEPLVSDPVPPATVGLANEARFGQYSIIFLLGALNSFLLLMLSDISDPFSGFWQVNLGPFHELSAALDEEIARDAIISPAAAAS